MTTVRATFRHESIEEQIAGGRYNPGIIARVRLQDRCLRLPIGAGTQDEIEVFSTGDLIIVATKNDRLDYAGIEAFDLDGASAGDVFTQSNDDAREMIGRKGVDYTLRTIARRLQEYLPY